jgi:DHA2 family multidrug resistance protein
MSETRPLEGTAPPGREERPSREVTRAEWKPRTNRWVLALVVTFAAFMEVLDTTIVNVSLPHIAGTMSASYDEASWTLTSYLVANGIVLTISGWLGRVLGRKRYFLICIGMFVVCSFLCGIANNLAMLILGRLAQGFFGGGLQPTQQAIIVDIFEPAERGRAFALTAIAMVVAPVIGPTVGGWITDNYSWRWIFLINIPVGALTFFAVTYLLEDPPWARRKPSAGFDVVGLSLITIGLGSLEIMVDRGEEEDWFGSNFIRTMGALALFGIAGAVFWLLYARKPVVNIRVLADRNFALCSLLMVIMAMVLYGSAVVIPQLAQQVLGYTATLAGMVLSPGALLLSFLIPLVSRLQQVVPTKYIVTVGYAILGLGMLYSQRLTPDISFNALVMMRTAQAAGLAFLFAPLTTMAFARIKREDTGDATALFTMFRNVAGSIGISLSIAMVTERTQAHMAYLSAHTTPLDLGYVLTLQQYQQSLMAHGHNAATAAQAAAGLLYQAFRQQATILAYIDVFAVCAFGAFCAIPVALLLARRPRAAKQQAA